MGLMSFLFEINEGAHGKRLESDFQTTMSIINGLDKEQFHSVIDCFVSRQLDILNTADSLTPTSGIALAKDLQSDARSVLQSNPCISYGLWMASAWIESLARSTEESWRIFEALEEIAFKAKRKNYLRGLPSFKWAPESEVKTGVPIEDLGIPYEHLDLNHAEAAFFTSVPCTASIDTFIELPFAAVVYPKENILAKEYIFIEKNGPTSFIIRHIDHRGDSLSLNGTSYSAELTSQWSFFMIVGKFLQLF